MSGDAAMWNPVQDISGPVPEAREMHGSFVSEGGKCMTIYGGRSMTGLWQTRARSTWKRWSGGLLCSRSSACADIQRSTSMGMSASWRFHGTDFAESFMTLGDDGTWTQAALAPYTPEEVRSCVLPGSRYCFGGSGQSGEIADLFKIALPAAT